MVELKPGDILTCKATGQKYEIAETDSMPYFTLKGDGSKIELPGVPRWIERITREKL